SFARPRTPSVPKSFLAIRLLRLPDHVGAPADRSEATRTHDIARKVQLDQELERGRLRGVLRARRLRARRPGYPALRGDAVHQPTHELGDERLGGEAGGDALAALLAAADRDARRDALELALSAEREHAA